MERYDGLVPQICSVTWRRRAAHNSFTYWVGKTCVIQVAIVPFCPRSRSFSRLSELIAHGSDQNIRDQADL
jgi:hypothetical protein